MGRRFADARWVRLRAPRFLDRCGLQNAFGVRVSVLRNVAMRQWVSSARLEPGRSRDGLASADLTAA
jgi:hypothetical protein